MKKFKKLTAGLLGVVMAMSVCSFTALADDEKTKYIETSAELVDAIENQEDGQTWVLKGNTTYDIGDEIYEFTKDNDKFTIDNHSNGFVFPIVVDGLTIQGKKGTVITSTYEVNTGNWNLQNFITISGSNVTIQDVDIKGNPNKAYGGTCNKAIELIDDGSDLTLSNVEILPFENSKGELFSGSIYYNVTNAGTCTIEDVTLYGWVNAKAVTSGKVVADGVVTDFRDNEYAGYSDETYGYAWNPGISGTNVSTKGDGLIIKVDEDTKLDKQIFNDQLKDGTTIELEDGTYELENKINILKDVKIVGNDSTLKYVGNTIYSNKANGSFIDVKNGADVTVEDLILDGNNGEKPLVRHGFNVFTGPNDDTAKLTLKNVEIKNCGAYAVVNNGSDVEVEKINTSGNLWGGINVDNTESAGKNGAKFTMVSGTIGEKHNGIKIENQNGSIIDAEIKDGKFEGPVYIADGVKNAELSIVSGEFSNDVSDYLDKGSHLVEDKDGNFVVYEDYLDDKKPSHSYELEEGRVEREDKEDEKNEPVVTPEEEAGPFSDVGKDNPNYDAIIKVYENGWMAGIGDGVFAPNGTLTRAMGATVLWNKAGKPEPQNVAPFLDVTSDAWYAKAVAWAYEQGIVAGYGETFGPGDALTTEQFTRMNDIATGKTPEAYIGGAPNATRGWVASLLAM